MKEQNKTVRYKHDIAERNNYEENKVRCPHQSIFNKLLKTIMQEKQSFDKEGQRTLKI